MKKFFLPLILVFCSSLLLAHDIDYGKVVLRKWKLSGSINGIEGSFNMLKEGEVYIEDADGALVHFPLKQFSGADLAYIKEKDSHISEINRNMTPLELNQGEAEFTYNYPLILFLILFAVFGVYAAGIAPEAKRKYLFPVFFLGGLFLLCGFGDNEIPLKVNTTTNPLSMDSAFAPFKPKINTFWDNTYFYVESKGMPDHQMMVGITSWQQQVPIPQCYTAANNNNAWSIPLNPVIAATPVPVNQSHFLRGAIAMAVNGVPIFNPYTNTGIDAFLDGQLDNWGGHCGRADDYHYHIAPLHLYGQVPLTRPIAFGLDGFAVYGSKEPDGSNMATLDTCHGHFGSNGVYHYHGTSGAPYMIGKMVGQVTEDATLQIIPQAAASSVRPALTPLNGATITNLVANGTGNGYDLTYTRLGQTYHVIYNWVDTTGVRSKYTFRFVNPASTGDSVYVGFSQSQCVVPNGPPVVIPTVKKSMKRLPDTGVSSDYTSIFGEDNDFLLYSPFFINNGNGTVTDTVTGLVWQKVDGGEMTFERAILYCDTLTLGGYTDWRLPDPNESFSILNQQLNNPTLDANYFTPSGGAADYWWTSSRQANDTTKVWCTNSGGGIGNKPKSETISAGGTKRYHVRAVRDASAVPLLYKHFANNGDGTVTDSLTNLMWTRVTYPDSLTWENALIYADTLKLAGYVDWRLPNIKELRSINEERINAPSVDTFYFKVTGNKKYWSGTTLKNATGTQAWFMNTQFGITSYDEKLRRNLVLCVRGSSNLTNKYVFTGNGNWDNSPNWLNYTIPPMTLPSGYSILIDPISTGQCDLNLTQIISAGGVIEVNPTKKFMVLGGLIMQ